MQNTCSATTELARDCDFFNDIEGDALMASLDLEALARGQRSPLAEVAAAATYGNLQLKGALMHSSADAKSGKLDKMEAKAAIADTRAGVKAATADARAGVKAATADARAGVKAATADARAGVKAATADARADVKSVTADSKAEVKSAMAEVKSATADSKSEVKSARSEVRSATAFARAELKAATVNSKAEVKSARADVKSATAVARAEVKSATADKKSELKSTTADASVEVKSVTAVSKAEVKSAAARIDAAPEQASPAAREFDFPFEPYPIQLQLMQAVHGTLSGGRRAGIFESPTGTGKSLSLLCSCLTWLGEEYARQRRWLAENGAATFGAASSTGTSAPDAWIAEFAAKRAQQRLADGTRAELEARQAALDRLARIRCGQEDDVALAAEEDAGDELSEGSEDCSVGQPTKILFASRTHSQLSQVVREFRRTGHAGRVSAVSLAARSCLCVNPAVAGLGAPALVNERCLELRRKAGRKGQQGNPDSSPPQPPAKRAKVAAKADGDSGSGGGGCPYYRREAIDSLAREVLRGSPPMDIEDLARAGRERGACPYYAARRAAPLAQLVLLPYQTLLHSGTRLASGLGLRDHVLVIDEAHNLLETLAGVHSVCLTSAQLRAAATQLADYEARYLSRMAPQNLLMVRRAKLVTRQLLAAIEGGCGTSGASGGVGRNRTSGVGTSGASGVGANRSSGVGTCGASSVGTTRTSGASGVGTSGASGVGTNRTSSVGTSGASGVVANRSSGVGTSGASGVGTTRTSGASGVGTSGASVVGTNRASGVGACGGVGTNRASGVGTSGASGVGTNGAIGDGTRSSGSEPSKASGEVKVFGVTDFHLSCGIDNVDLPDLLRRLREARLARKVGGVVDGSGGGSSDGRQTPLLQLQAFLSALLTSDSDGRVLVNPAGQQLKYLLLNPAAHFADVVRQARCVILAGGTMRPVDDLVAQLFRPAGCQQVDLFSCGHVVPKENVLALCVGRHRHEAMTFTHAARSRQPDQLLSAAGEALLDLLAVTPAGVVVFFPSHDWEAAAHARWQADGCLARIGRLKRLFREPRLAGEVDALLLRYQQAAVEGGGSVLFAVVGGRLSEGINFADDFGRCVVMLGMPYPNAASPELRETMAYLAARYHAAAGKSHYEGLCMRAVNQCIGRAIRHRGDFAAIVLMDARYARPAVQSKLPDWIGQSFLQPPGGAPFEAGEAAGVLGTFFSGKASQLRG